MIPTGYIQRVKVKTIFRHPGNNSFSRINIFMKQPVAFWCDCDIVVEIYDGNILLDKVYIDQSQNSGEWNVLGSYDFSGDAKVTIISESNACSTAADALKLSK